MSEDNNSYANAVLSAYANQAEMVERERQAFATALKKRTAFLASLRDTRRSRKRAQARKAEPESFDAKLTGAIRSRLARQR